MEGSLNITGSFLIKGNQIQGIRSDRVSEELRTEVRDIVEEAVIKTIPKKKKGIFIGKSDAGAEAPILWLPDGKN